MATEIAVRKNEKTNATEVALNAVQRVYDEYVVFPTEEARDSVVLWTLHCHVFQAFESTPRLSIRSAEPGSGKSRVLEVMEHMVPRALCAVYLTPGVMWRAIENGRPTLMLDEADTIFGKVGSGSAHRYLRGIINAGHRKGATVPRCVGTEDVKQFHVYAPVVMAGLGRLPETIANRSVEIVMRRRRKGDHEVKPFRLRFAEAELKKAFELCEEWAHRAEFELAYALPELPVKDRDADVWEPLVAIAEMASEEWGKRALKACKDLTSEAKDKPLSVGAQLLKDIKQVFGEEAQMFTWEILGGLYALEDSEWDAQFDARKLSKVLAEYGVAPVMVRKGTEVARGYRRANFEDAWERYLPEDKPEDEEKEA